MRRERKGFTKLIGVWLAILLLAVSLAACSSSDRSDSKALQTAASEAKSEAAPPAMPETDSATADGAAVSSDTANQTTSGSGIADTTAQADFHRQVIYTADLHMQVKDFASARGAIDQLITSSGGYLLSFTEDESTEQLRGSFKIKVPAKGFDTFIDAIDKLPDKKLSKSINGEDVTEEYADLSSRLNAKEIAEARLLSFMESAKTSKDLVTFSNELAQVQEDIERIKGRMRFIDENVEYSTINIDMYQTISGTDSELVDLNEKPSLMSKAGDALRQSADMIFAIGNAIVIVAAFLLPLLPIIAIIVIIVIVVNRRRKRTKKNVAQVIPQQTEQTDETDQTPPNDEQQ